MAYRSTIAELTRMRDLDGTTLSFSFRHQRGRSAHDFIEKDAVPDFEGESAWFEIVKVAAVPWPRWTVVRRAEEGERLP